MVRRTKKINYLSNKELLKEIFKSKNSYCEFIDPKYQFYDIIIENKQDILNPIKIQEAKQNRINRLNEEKADLLFKQGMTNKQINELLKEENLQPESIDEASLIFRVMTNDHIPDVKYKETMIKVKVNFPPFAHYINENGEIKCVGKSHFKNNQFNKEHGKISDQLAMSLLKLVDKYGNKGNWRGYSWLDEMKGHAIVRLCQIALQFNEAKSQNPFAWYTTVINRSFTYVLNSEKEYLSFKNKLLQDEGLEHTFNEQAAHAEQVYYESQGLSAPNFITNKPLNYYRKKITEE